MVERRSLDPFELLGSVRLKRLIFYDRCFASQTGRTVVPANTKVFTRTDEVVTKQTKIQKIKKLKGKAVPPLFSQSISQET